MANALWIGDIDKWMDENFIYSLFAHTGELVNVKIIRDKNNGQSSGFGFVYFSSPTAAQYVLDNYNGQPIPGTNKVFRLNWAAYGMNAQRNESQALFVGDLAPDVNEYYLLQTFQYYYPSVYSAKVVTEPHTGMSKGYGFVYFNDDAERNRSLTEMQGFYLSYRPIKVNLASKKNQPLPMPTPTMSPTDPNNTTVFVGGIDPTVTHEILRAAFSPFGEIASIKIPYGKGCGFVDFATHEQAANVLKQLNGAAIIGTSQVRLSWGRPNATRSPTHSTSTQIYPRSSGGDESHTSSSLQHGVTSSSSSAEPTGDEVITKPATKGGPSSSESITRASSASTKQEKESSKEKDEGTSATSSSSSHKRPAPGSSASSSSSSSYKPGKREKTEDEQGDAASGPAKKRKTDEK